MLRWFWQKPRLPADFPAEWLPYLRRVFEYDRLNAATREQLERLTLQFANQYRFEGCGGLELTAEHRITIAGHVARMSLGWNELPWKRHINVLLYPAPFVAHQQQVDRAGVVTEFDDVRLGEAWQRGPIVLSWADVLLAPKVESALDEWPRRSSVIATGRNVAIHEFAHQLDALDGEMNGVPGLPTAEAAQHFAATLQQEWATWQRALRLGRFSCIDEYGVTNLIEFFAVVTESFFSCPRKLQVERPTLYALWRDYFRQDPAAP